jgi:hypothetical protein
MLSPCLIWSETRQKIVVDGEVGVGLLLAAMAARCSVGWGSKGR